MSTVQATPNGGDQILVTARGHSILLDQPASAGGTDNGPTPTELFVGGLAACVAHYANSYLRRHDIDPSGLGVRADFDLATDRPARIASIRITIDAPPALPPARHAAFLAVASHCTVHNTLSDPPRVAVEIAKPVIDLAS